MGRGFDYSSDSDSKYRQDRGKKVSDFSKRSYRFNEPGGAILRQDIQKEKSAIDGSINSAEQVKETKMFLDAIKEEVTDRQLTIPKEYRFAILDQAVHPDELMKRFLIVKQNSLEAQSFINKDKTKEDIKGYILEWKRDRQLFKKLVDQMKKSPEEVREEVKEKLPELEKEAQSTLGRLEDIPDWQKKVAKLEPQLQEKFNLSRGLMKKYLGVDASDVSEEINVKDYLGDDSTRGPRLYAELDYRTRTLSKLIDRIIEPDKLPWQGSPERTLKVLVSDVVEAIDLLDEKGLKGMISNKTKLEDYIYQLGTSNDKQQGFSTQPTRKEYRQSIESITFPPHMEKTESSTYIFFQHHNEYPNRRFIVNMRPDAMLEGEKEVNGKTKEMIEKVTQLECVTCAKVASGRTFAVERVDPVIIYANITDRKSEDAVAECLRPYEQFTRPGLPAGVRRIYNGIGCANESLVKEGSSWTGMIADSIAEVVSKLNDKERPITFETVWPRVESDLRKKGIIEL